jgi:hypothetical protein
MAMNLLKNIKNGRARQRRKQPWGRDPFHAVSSLVKGYGLGEDFLKGLDQAEDGHTGVQAFPIAVRAKVPFDFPPFSLAAEGEYRLVLAILAKLNNPYLRFAHSPEEMLLSAALFAANPALRPEDLLRFDFATLLLSERAQEELARLERTSGTVSGAPSPGREDRKNCGDPAHEDVLGERIQQLRNFIASVASGGYQRE